MKPQQHLVISGVIGAAVYGVTGSAGMAAGCVIAGVLVDIDHFVDYWREHPGRMNARHFYETCLKLRLSRTYLFLHSVEVLILLVISAYYAKSPALAGVALGFAQHFLLDILFNPIRPGAFFLVYRIVKGAATETVFYPKDHGKSGTADHG